jgi:hypothetical protein
MTMFVAKASNGKNASRCRMSGVDRPEAAANRWFYAARRRPQCNCACALDPCGGHAYVAQTTKGRPMPIGMDWANRAT